MPNSVAYAMSCTLGSLGKLTPNRSALLAYWIHSCAKDGWHNKTANVAVTAEIRRMVQPPAGLGRAVLPILTGHPVYWHLAAPLPSAPPLSRYTLWQFAHASLSFSLTSPNASSFLARDACRASLPASTSAATYCFQSAWSTGASLPFWHRRPGVSSSAAVSVSATAA